MAAIRGERAHIQFRGFSPAERDSLVQALGNKITVQESPWDCSCSVAINHEKKPFDDKRVRRALTWRSTATRARRRCRRSRSSRRSRGIQVPGTPCATPPAELEKLAGYGRDINEARAEATAAAERGRRPEGFAFTFKNRGIPHALRAARHLAHRPVAADRPQREAGVDRGRPRTTRMLRAATSRWPWTSSAASSSSPTSTCYKFLSTDRNPANYGRYKDTVLDDSTTSRAAPPTPRSARSSLRQFEKRLLDEEAHYLITLQWHRIVPHSAKVKGWTITPSHYLNNQLDTVWLSE